MFWSILEKEFKNKKKLNTLVLKREFTAWFKNEKIVEVEPKKGSRRYHISQKTMKNAWDIAKKTRIDYRFRVYSYRNKIAGPSYVTTFLSNYLGRNDIE